MNSGGKIFLIYTKIKPEPARVDQRFWKREGVGGGWYLGVAQGLYPFSKTNFQDFSRTQIDFSRTLKFTLTLSLP